MLNFRIRAISFGICAAALFCFSSSQVIYKHAYAQRLTQDEKEEEALFVGKKALEDGFYEVAIGLFERFIKNFPDSPKSAQVNLLVGQCYFHQNKFLDALAKFEWLLTQPNAGNIQDAVFYWIAEVHFKANNFSKASLNYRKIIDNFPSSAYAGSAYYSLGWCQFQDNSYSGALDYFKIIEVKFPKESFAKESSFKVIECLYNLKDYTQLKNRLKSYLKIYSQDKTKLPYLYFYMAEADYYLNNFSEAIEEYSQVLTNTSDEKIQALSKLGIGWASLKLKKYKGSEEAFMDIKADNLEKASLEVLMLGKAILMQETSRFNEANKIYTELIDATVDPMVEITAFLGKADALYNTNDYKEAINIYKEAELKLPQDIHREIIDKLYYGLAWSYLKEGQFKEAIDAFQKIAKFSDDKIVKVSALCQIGDAYQDSGDYVKANEAYDSILKDYADSLYSDYVQYQLGLSLLKSSNYDGAALALQTFKRNYPNSKLLDDASYALGLSYFQREDYGSSKEIFEKFQDEFKDSYLKPQAMYLWGTSLYNLEKFSEAIGVFKDIIRVYNQDTELVQKSEYEIADCLYRMGEEKEAMARFKLLRSKYPDSKLTPEVIWWLGEYYYRHNDSILARRYFSSLIQDFPKSNLISNAYYALGSTFEEEANYDEALKNFQKVLEIGKSGLSGTALVAIADIYVLQGKIELALKTYKDIIREFPNLGALVFPKIADMYRKLGNYQEAVDYYRKSLDLVPVNEMSGIQFKLAEIREAEGKLDEAIEEYMKGVYLFSENNTLAVKSLLRVAAINETKENFKEALSIYKRVISMGVDEAKYAQERIDWIKTNIK